ncbi:MAG: hypothetical protein EPO31_06900 [Gammaproteobacteria bacterium]|nr:MAG: hypothetical protein EPO31_06900 [Gammaproteobacteria bacterium]
MVNRILLKSSCYRARVLKTRWRLSLNKTLFAILILIWSSFLLSPTYLLAQESAPITSKAPHSLDNVSGFKWYIVTSARPTGSRNCEIDINPVIRNLIKIFDNVDNLNISFHESGGASDVFLFRLYFDTFEIKGRLYENVKCILRTEVELAYFEKLRFLNTDRTPPLPPKFVLWSLPSSMQEVVPDNSNNVLGANGDISDAAANYAIIAATQLLGDIEAVKKYGFVE